MYRLQFRKIKNYNRQVQEEIIEEKFLDDIKGDKEKVILLKSE